MLGVIIAIVGALLIAGWLLSTYYFYTVFPVPGRYGLIVFGVGLIIAFLAYIARKREEE